MPAQDLPPSERKEAAKVEIIGPAPKAQVPPEAGPPVADLFTPDPLYGQSSVIHSPTMRDDFPAWTAKFDIRKAGDQLFLRGYYPNYKGYVYFVPDKWLRKNANGDFLPYGVDGAKLSQEQSNTIKTNDPNFRPWQDKAADKLEDLSIAGIVVLIGVGIAAVLKRRGWVR